MDERALSELLECSVCLESLDATSKVLPCQHTFCKRCLEEIVSTKNELRCPECRTLVNIPVEELPTNILLIRLLEGMKTARAGFGSSGTSERKPGLPSPTGSRSGVGPSSAAAKAASPYKTVNITVPCAKALYSYDAKEPGDLSFKKGDTIILRKQVDENWYHGEMGNKHGFFPATYVLVITPLPQEIPTCKALYDFVITDKNEKDCLTFQKDEMVTVIRRIDNNWAEGKLGERIGIFPISFVEMNDSAKWLINTQANQARNNSNNHVSHSSSNTTNGNATKSIPVTLSPSSATTAITSPTPSTDISPTPTTSGLNPFLNASLLATKYLGQKRHSLTSIGQKLSLAVQNQHRHSVELSGTTGLTTTISPASSTSVTPAITQSLVSSPATTTAPSMMSQSMIERTPDSPLNTAAATPAIYIALYNYKPVKDDEVELKKGDYYVVSEKCQDGWFKGTCLRNGTAGVFPGNYVQAVKLANKTGNRTVLGTSGQQHLHQQHLQQQAAAAGTVSGSPLASTTALKSPHHHISVSRAHSFPKTSPLAIASDYQSRTGASSRTTNVTTSQGRFTNSSSFSASTSSSSQSQVSSSSSSQKISSGASHSATAAHTQSSRTAGLSSAATQSAVPPSVVTQAQQEKTGRRSPSHTHAHSPRSSRKATMERVAKHAAAISGLASAREAASASAVAPPPVAARSSSSNSGLSKQQQSHHSSSSSNPMPSAHSMLSTTATIVPPNKVVGATVDDFLPVGAISQLPSHRERDFKEFDRRDKEKKEKKERDRLSIVKRLTKSKRSKSPPPEAESSTSTDASSSHQRTSSLPASDEPAGGAAAAAKAPPPLPHRKTSSLDSSSKTPRTKPFLRERFRCIVPYPPQSEIEIELKLGDIVYVHKKRDDGWCRGTLQRTGKTGLFPANFVEKF